MTDPMRRPMYRATILDGDGGRVCETAATSSSTTMRAPPTSTEQLCSSWMSAISAVGLV